MLEAEGVEADGWPWSLGLVDQDGDLVGLSSWTNSAGVARGDAGG